MFVILLNLAGVAQGKTLGAYRPWIIIGTFVFAAVATPSTDPFTMLILAVPMLVLFGISEVIARVLDRRRGRSATSWPSSADDEVVAAVTALPTLDRDVDPFDLPEWLGEAEVDLDADARRTPRAPRARARSPAPATTTCPATCWPSTTPTRSRWPTTTSAPAPTWPGGTARSCWCECEDRLTLAVPGTSFTADLCLDAIGRLAKAVGASGRRLRRPAADRRRPSAAGEGSESDVGGLP